MSTELIEALLKPSAYPHPVEKIELLETHISWVILTGERVYKIKKPMDFGFLNFTKLEDRKTFCELEMKLNQRLAPRLYDSVIPISGSPDNPILNDNTNPIEYAIVMHQFPQENMLDAISSSGKLTLEPLLDVAEQLADFHQNIEVSTSEQHYGSAEHVWFPVKQNFDQIRPLLSQKQDLLQLDKLEQWASESYQSLLPLIRERKAEGFIKACHGDVHLGNITLFEDKVTLFDCIEFNEDFRWTDTMADLGFLCMDLDSRGLSHLSSSVVNRYMEINGDFRGLGLLNFYKAYRAVVRAKVVLFRLHGDDITDPLRSEVLAEYRQYTDLAESYCTLEKPFLAMMQGLSGSGKTTAGRELVEHSNCVMLRTDIERKRLFGLKPEASSHDAKLDIYTQEATDKTYLQIQSTARFLLSQGISVVIDGASLKLQERSLCCQPAIELKIPYFIVKCMAPDNVLKSRIIKRQFNNSDASEATTDLIQQQHQWEEPLSDHEEKHTIVLNTADKGWRKKLLSDLTDQLN
ncbi:bifunctional aminoglycoside phosphotransferase/ATP-binding protein [Endozoicomonas numazuensis]|uniref:bifunctional aminoglycoside phosphotransferase/ATP-binding protein n=1 Tax=Endozoicomonas numazuensis TaxID=1137799 RepID=UPI00054DEEDF|nr:bifunctional aminoglycoside phosphotransferase/ATP-binding protein [Endozoicomonas numazuensis]